MPKETYLARHAWLLSSAARDVICVPPFRVYCHELASNWPLAYQQRNAFCSVFDSQFGRFESFGADVQPMHRQRCLHRTAQRPWKAASWKANITTVTVTKTENHGQKLTKQTPTPTVNVHLPMYFYHRTLGRPRSAYVAHNSRPIDSVEPGNRPPKTSFHLSVYIGGDPGTFNEMESKNIESYSYSLHEHIVGAY